MSEAAIGDEVGQAVYPSQAAPVFSGRYLSLTSFRRDGTGVATPVWFVQQDGRLLVLTDAGSYKVKRIRRNPAVTVAPCTASGRLRGQAVSGFAVVLADAEIPAVQRLLARKYRVDMLFFRPIRWLQKVLAGRRSTPLVLAITLR
jgi:PPOX class probable F420-dependent enzyme